MSAIKRWIDDECEAIAKETGLNWELVMDIATELEFDMEATRKEALRFDESLKRDFPELISIFEEELR